MAEEDTERGEDDGEEDLAEDLAASRHWWWDREAGETGSSSEVQTLTCEITSDFLSSIPEKNDARCGDEGHSSPLQFSLFN